jgi:hypothetical protein
MADKTILRRAAFGMAVDAESHVDFVHWHYPVHRFHGSVTFLTGNPRPDMGFVHELYKVGQFIDSIPADFERRLMIIRPRLGYRLDTAEQSIAMTTDAAFYGWHSRRLRAACIFVAVLTGNFIDSRMNPMAEGNRLCNVIARRPRPLREADHRDSGKKQEQRNWNQNAVHRSHSSHHGDTMTGWMLSPANM